MASDFGRLKSMIKASFSVKSLAGLNDIETEISEFSLLKFRLKSAQFLMLDFVDLFS